MQRIEKPSRMNWFEIMETYPDLWVGIRDVSWEKGGGTVESAVVEYIDGSGGSLTDMQVSSGGDLIAVYTTPDNVLQLGMVEVM